MINGHMDTSYTGTDEDKMFCRETIEPDSDLKGAIRDGKVFLALAVQYEVRFGSVHGCRKGHTVKPASL